MAFAAAPLMEIGSAAAHDETKYPDLRGQWTAIGGSVKYAPDKPRGLGQEAPLTPEYQAIFEANDVAEGGQGNDPPPGACRRGCRAYDQLLWRDQVRHNAGNIARPGLPRARQPHIYRRARRSDLVDPSFLGISIGRWVDTKGDGHCDVLEVETRDLVRARSMQRTTFGCGQSDHPEGVLYLHWNNPDVISNEVTVFDHALTLGRDQTLSPQRRPASVVGRGPLHGKQLSYPHPGRTVLSQRRRNAHAYKQRSANS
jgi:hypothetical protein